MNTTVRSWSAGLAAAAWTAVLAGCADTGHEGATPPPSYLARQASLNEELKELSQEVRALRAAQDELAHAVSDEALRKPVEDSLARLAARVEEIERRTGALERAMASQREESGKKLKAVIEVVKSENEQLRGAIRNLRGGPSSGGGEHTVRPGETLEGIARSYGLRVRDLIEANGIKDADHIPAGRKLAIPRAAGHAQGSAD